MANVTSTVEEPPKELRFRRRVGFRSAFRELWRSRELVRTLAERDIRARYKQAYLGVAWAFLAPLAMMVVFSLFLQRVAKFETHGVPYPLFTYVGLLPWTFFSSSVSNGGTSLTINQNLLNKVYCPREAFPLASMAVAGFDMVVASTVLVVLFVIEQFMPYPEAIWVPVLLLVLVVYTAAVTLITAALLVYFRDLRQVLPILLQVALFATPVAYGMNLIPVQYQLIYSIANPLAPVIDGMRRTMLYGQPPDFHLLVPAAISASLMLIVFYRTFKRLETGLADVA